MCFFHDLRVKKTFLKEASYAYQIVIDNINNEISYEQGLPKDVFFVCISGCHLENDNKTEIIQFSINSKENLFFRTKRYSITYSYNRH